MRYSLKELRARHDLSQSDMAEKLGVTVQTYNAWEQNFTNIKLSQACEVANILQVELEEIQFDRGKE